MHRSFKQLALYKLNGRLMGGDATECVRLAGAELGEDFGIAEPAVRDMRKPLPAYRRE